VSKFPSFKRVYDKLKKKGGTIGGKYMLVNHKGPRERLVNFQLERKRVGKKEEKRLGKVSR